MSYEVSIKTWGVAQNVPVNTGPERGEPQERNAQRLTFQSLERDLRVTQVIS